MSVFYVRPTDGSEGGAPAGADTVYHTFLDLGTSPYYYALQGAEPFLARASQDLFGAGGTTAQVRAALLRL